MTFQDALYRRVLLGISEDNFDLSAVPDVQDLFDKLRDYRSKLKVGDPLKHCRLPDERSQGRPVRPMTHCQRIKLSAGR